MGWTLLLSLLYRIELPLRNKQQKKYPSSTAHAHNRCPSWRNTASRPSWRRWMWSGRRPGTTCLWRWRLWDPGSWLSAVRLSSAGGFSCVQLAGRGLAVHTGPGSSWACGTVCWHCRRRTWWPEDRWGRPSYPVPPSQWGGSSEGCCHERRP